MKSISKKVLLALALGLTSLTVANAGGMMTNTNQNIAFLRNPARDGAIGIDGVYSNPAGVVFMEEGCHLSLNWQTVSQKRIINTTSKYLDNTLSDNIVTKEYSGKATSNFVPSIQFAKNQGDWSFQFNFGINGGGGKLKFDNGLGTFDNAVGNIANMLKPFGGTGYNVNNYMSGEQRYYGFTVGAAYKVNPHVSVYGGIRALVGDANYHAHIENITVNTPGGAIPFSQFLDQTNNVTLPALEAQINMIPDPTLKAQKLAEYQVTKTKIQELEVYRNGVNLRSDQSGHGFAPILGVDLNYDKFNFATKYEFKTKMSMKNRSTLKQALAIPEINTFIDGTDMEEDTPALLAMGAQWSLKPDLRLSLGYHHYYDKAAKKSYCYINEAGKPIVSDQKNSKYLSHGSNEYLAGVEYDVNKKLTLSVGGQITRYGLTDAYMSDISFVVDSWSLGLGARYKVRDNAAIQLAFFKTFYKDYTTANHSDTYTRKNKVFGIGYDISFK